MAEAEGVVICMRSEPRPDRPCTCCPDGKGHVFARYLSGDFGPDEPGTTGPRRANATDWLERQIWKLPEGATVRLSIEIVELAERPTDA